MPSFFPHHPIELHLEEPAAFRRFSFSLVEMAIVTGVLLRLFRVVALAHGSSSWIFVGSTFAVGLIVLLGMATAHLANFPLSQWGWRLAAFAAIEIASELITSAVLISVGREPIGSVRATFSDLPALLQQTVLMRGLALAVWGLSLAGIVTMVRNRLVMEDAEES